MEALPDLTIFQSPWKLASPCTPMATKQCHYRKQRHHPYGRGTGHDVPQQELPQTQYHFPDVSKLMGTAMNSHLELNNMSAPYTSGCYSDTMDYMYPIYYTSYPHGYNHSTVSNDYMYPSSTEFTQQQQPPMYSYMNYIPLQFNDVTFNTDMFRQSLLQDCGYINTDEQSSYACSKVSHEYMNNMYSENSIVEANLLKMFKPHKSIEVSTKALKKTSKTHKEVEYSVIKSTNGDRYQCTTCQQFFTTLSAINEHCKSCSVQERPYKCDFCDKLFKSSSTLRVHRRVHTGYKPYQCKHCDLYFSDNSTRTKHERVHTKSKPYQCNVCGVSFTQSGNLRRHMRNKHKLN